MRIQPTLILISAIAAAQAVSAQRWEAIAGFDGSDIESEDNLYSVSIERFFEPLDATSRFPLDEIAFGERIASASVFGSYTNADPQSQYSGSQPDSYSFEGSGKSTRLGGRYIYRKAGSSHAFQVAANYNRGDGSSRIAQSDPIFQFKSSQASDQDSFSLTARYDYYLTDLWTLGFSAEREEATVDSNSSTEFTIRNRPALFSSSIGRYEGTTYHFEITTERLWDLGKDRWLGVIGSVEYVELDGTQRSSIIFPSNWSTQPPGAQPGDEAEQRYAISGNTWTYSAEGRYYFNRRTSVSAGLEQTESSDVNRWTIGASRYLTDRFFIRVEGTRSIFNLPDEFDDSDYTLDSWRIRLGTRF